MAWQLTLVGSVLMMSEPPGVFGHVSSFVRACVRGVGLTVREAPFRVL